MTVVNETAPGTGVFVVSVFRERIGAQLDRQALLKVVNLGTLAATWQTTEDNAQGALTNLPFGSYNLEVSAVGYLSVRQEVQLANSRITVPLEVVLHRDPAALNLDGDDRVLPPKARKETKQAVSALKSGNFKDAQKHLDAAYALAPTSGQLNFLLGYLYFQKKDYDKASSYLGTATTLAPGDAQSLTLLGRACLERKDYPAAQSALERAVAADAANWTPHDLLADAYFRQKLYDKARDEAQVAIAKGNAAASPAQLILGQSLINLGLNQQGIQALNTFLQQSPTHPMAGQVRRLIADVQEQDASPSAGDAGNSIARLSGVDPLQALAGPVLSVKSWQPPGVDDIKLALAPGVDCPADHVIEETGKHVAELVDDVMRFAAVEDMFHQSLDPFGNPTRSETRKYNYTASISEPEPGFLSVEEFRADKMGLEGYPDHIASNGFAALAFVFHPHMRDNFEMKCEGLGDWHGQASWLVHFQQRDDKPNRMHAYQVGKQLHPVKLKGRAWITADKFQIVRIESEMVKPMPEIRLLSEHQVVEYGPIQFEKKKTSLWLPKTAELYFDFRQHRYYRRHRFQNYMLFSVDSDEKRKEPATKAADQPAPSTITP
jgi:tetratricopeptide (TPR) repeat protein